MTGNVDLHTRYVTALRMQKTAESPSDALPCPWCSHNGRMFRSDDQFLDHVNVEHASILQSMRDAALRM